MHNILFFSSPVRHHSTRSYRSSHLTLDSLKFSFDLVLFFYFILHSFSFHGSDTEFCSCFGPTGVSCYFYHITSHTHAHSHSLFFWNLCVFFFSCSILKWKNQFQQSVQSFASLENKTAAQAANSRSSSEKKRSEKKSRMNDEEFYSIFIFIFISCWMLFATFCFFFFLIHSLSAILMCPSLLLSLALVRLLPLRHHLALWSCVLAFNVFFVTLRSSTHLPLFILLTHRKWIY